MMGDQVSFVEIINSQLNSDKAQLPVFNKTAMRIQNEIAKRDPDVRLIEKLIVSDQALTGEVLRVSNSSFYKGLQEITTIHQAVIRLGINEVSNMTTLITHKNQFRSKEPILNDIMRNLWRHAVGCAFGSHWLAGHCDLQGIKHESFFAGLLHDVGKLHILKIADSLKKNNGIGTQISNALLTEAMDSLHAECGSALMRHWNLPEKYCEIARRHHADEIDSKNLLMALVRMADKACHKLGIGLRKDPSLVLSATPESEVLRLSEVNLANLEIFLEDTHVVNL
jgi:HD-like signal output (HDOD) protein